MRTASRRSTLWAIRGVDLTIAPGECVGVIGRNGSGKSTLLQLLGGVTAPTEGRVEVYGRIAPLISVGVGFHPELTGRENVYVNATILGLERAEIDERLDAIVEFAEIGDFLDTPVKFYSSGMFVRLGFAVAVHAEPDVLLVDEVLAVGDLAFQLKCFERMTAIRDRGTTIVVVSHNLNAIRQLCERTLVVHDGRVRFAGPSADAIAVFHDLLGEAREPGDAAGAPVAVDGTVQVQSFELLGGDGAATRHVTAGEPVTFETTVRFDRDIDDAVVGFALTNERGIPVYSDMSTTLVGPFRAGDTRVIRVRFAAALTTGSYSAISSVVAGDLTTKLGGTSPLLFYVAGRHTARGAADLGAAFEVGAAEPALGTAGT